MLQLMGNGTEYTIDVAPGVDWTAICAMIMVMKQVLLSVFVPHLSLCLPLQKNTVLELDAVAQLLKSRITLKVLVQPACGTMVSSTVASRTCV